MQDLTFRLSSLLRHTALMVSNIKWPLFGWLFLQQSALLSSASHTSLTALTTIIMINNNTEQCNCNSNCNCQVGSCTCKK
ncbi:uncharacterized protein F5147DRAFT_722976 [Suillus discolor]|uniref:Uncharacterized protein n=1 Tax=Suillus discolor TaxID=1912936 RepID=A0A9P7EWB8_9AGAM|nr:uncharacterized protein F5147DRAFT_722976 [Suillus discolor]KAG2091834.1 hypothetical protein F5147DRAFT_722976 [Suillus discolor]